jgi:hypothetical protein
MDERLILGRISFRNALHPRLPHTQPGLSANMYQVRIGVDSLLSFSATAGRLQYLSLLATVPIYAVHRLEERANWPFLPLSCSFSLFVVIGSDAMNKSRGDDKR